MNPNEKASDCDSLLWQEELDFQRTQFVTMRFSIRKKERISELKDYKNYIMPKFFIIKKICQLLTCLNLAGEILSLETA